MVLGDARALMLADRAADYLHTHFKDHVHGGYYWALGADGRPVDTKKQGYAQAFVAYGLCAHHRATGSSASLERAREAFHTIERHFLNAKYGGYIEALSEDWSPLADMRLSAIDANCPKSTNTHLHILEAYTSLFAAAPSQPVAQALHNLITLFLERLIDTESGHLRLFFDLDWTDQTSFISFGHDIEASWLLWRACETLGDPALLSRAKPLVLKLARTCLYEALDAEGGIANERARSGAPDARRVWWVQAEALIGFLNAYELSGEQNYLHAFGKVWRFIQSRQRDTEGGEWTWWSALDSPDADRQYKAGFWKCPYHNGRAMFESMARLAPITNITR
jgi:mannobiose 2-epimerase